MRKHTEKIVAPKNTPNAPENTPNAHKNTPNAPENTPNAPEITPNTTENYTEYKFCPRNYTESQILPKNKKLIFFFSLLANQADEVGLTFVVIFPLFRHHSKFFEFLNRSHFQILDPPPSSLVF